MRQLKNVNVTHVSIVDKAANKKKFLLTKSDSEPTFETSVKLVTKADDPQKLVYGLVYEPNVEDAHGDYMDAETIEKAAHGFMENYQNIDKQHDFATEAGKVVESYIAPADMTIGENTIVKGTWMLVTKATDEMWEAIQKGEFTGYSLAGTAEVEDVQKRTKDIFDKGKTYRDVDSAISAFRSATWSILDNYQQSDADKIMEIQSEITELSQLIASIQPVAKKEEPTTKSEKQGFAQTISSVVKSIFTPNKEEDEEMNQEELKKVLGEALNPISNRLDALEKANKKEGVVEEPEEDTKDGKKKKKDEMDAEVIAKAIADAVAPLSDKIEKLEKSRISNVTEQNYQTESVEKASSVPSYVNDVFPVSE